MSCDQEAVNGLSLWNNSPSAPAEQTQQRRERMVNVGSFALLLSLSEELDGGTRGGARWGGGEAESTAERA